MTPKEIEDCLRVLEELVADRSGLAAVDKDTRNRFLTAAGRVSRPERTEQRVLARTLGKRKKSDRRAATEALLVRTGIRKNRLQPVFVTPEPLALAASQGSVSGEPDPDAPDLTDVRVCYVDPAVMTTAGIAPEQDIRSQMPPQSSALSDSSRLAASASGTQAPSKPATNPEDAGRLSIFEDFLSKLDDDKPPSAEDDPDKPDKK